MATIERRSWIITLAAAAILMVTMGVRQSYGLFVSPLNTTTGLGIVTISFALAVGQFMWGAVQPIASAPFMGSGAGLVIALGLVSQIGSGASSFSVLIGAAALPIKEAPPAARLAPA